MMKFFSKTWAATVLCTIAAAAANGAQAPVVVDKSVAEVGGRRVTLSEVMAEIQEMLFDRREAPTEASVKALYPEAISNLVARQLILLEYEKSEVKIPEWYLNQRIERTIEGNFGGDKARLVALLNERGVTFPEWRRRRVEDTIVGTMRQQFVGRGIAASPAEMERVYRENYSTNTLPGHVKVSMIMLKTPGEGDDADAPSITAAELLGKLERGGSFEALARQYSLENHSKDGGSWGYVEPEDEFRPEIAAAIAELPVGGISGPVEVGGFTYILRKDDEREDLSVPFDVVRDEIEGDLLAQAAERRFAEWVRHLATKHTVRIYPAQ